MLSAECQHGMTAEFCADCAGRDGGERALREQRAALLATRGWFPSQYGGRCYDCGEPFAAGDPISASGRSGIASWRAGCCA